MPQCTVLVEQKVLSCSDVAVCTSSYPQTIMKNRLSVIYFFFYLKNNWQAMPLKQFPLSSSFLIVLFVCLFVCLFVVCCLFFFFRFKPTWSAWKRWGWNKEEQNFTECGWNSTGSAQPFISFISHLLNSQRLTLLYLWRASSDHSCISVVIFVEKTDYKLQLKEIHNDAHL